MTTHSPPSAVLARYAPALDALTWVRAGGGFSGADVFRGGSSGVPVAALKAWPPEVTPARVSQIHAWVKRAAHLPFVPSLLPTTDGSTLVSHAGRVWDVTRWMPGAPREVATVPDVEAACTAVARLHTAWPAETRGPCPAVLARLRALADFLTYFPRGPNFRADLPAPVHQLLRRGHDLVVEFAPGAERALGAWAAVPFDLRPCVRDLRGAHVLFTGPAVTGVIDFGAMGVDHPAADLARLLGDLAGEDDSLFAAGLRAYRAAERLGCADDFVRLLDRAGAVCSVVGWLVRLGDERRACPDAGAVADRLGRLVSRVERFRHF